MESSTFVIIALLVLLIVVTIHLLFTKAKYKKAKEDIREYKRKEFSRAIVLGYFSSHEQRNKNGS